MISAGMIVIIIMLALIFDFINGFHDTANAIATSISTRALTPRTAVIMAGSLNFLGALSGTAVASAIGENLVSSDMITAPVMIAALMAAIFWNLFTWYFGIPSSSSHALIGALIGAVTAGFGLYAVMWKGFWIIFVGLIISPAAGMLVGSIIMTLLFWIFRKASPARINNTFRKLQIISACMASFAHGSNDAQKTMGIITLLLLGGGILQVFDVPLWVKIVCAGSMALGTAVGGWRIIKTMGRKIFRIEPIHGFASDITSSLVIYSASLLGAPVSTTHVVSSAIMGVGAARRIKGVRWNTARQIVIAWFVTIPSCAAAAILIYNIMQIMTMGI